MKRPPIAPSALLVSVILAGCVFAPPPGKGRLAEERFKHSNVVIAALARYREKHGKYPVALLELVPSELAGIPKMFVQSGVTDGGSYQVKGSAYELSFRYYEGGMNECLYQPGQQWFCHGYI